MFLRKLLLNNFRLHRDTEIDFSNELNYIVGGNGQGKTTILEAIYYLCTAKNINQNSDNEVVTFGENNFSATAFFSDLIEYKSRVFFGLDSNKKIYFLNDKQLTKLSSFIGKFPVVSLTPVDFFITQGQPADRRKFVDSIISQINPTYLDYLLEYNRILKQRSVLLNQLKETKNKNLLTQLDAWTEMLAKNGTEIVKHRKVFISDFRQHLIDNYANFVQNNESPEIIYNFLDTKNNSDIEKKFIGELERNREQEIIRGKNLVGPHRDDFWFFLNNKELKKFGSQGQHKTFQIALRFAQFFYMFEYSGKKPIFLMDDIFGDLDSVRVKKIGSYLKSIGQAFITLTDFNNNDKIFRTDTDKFISVNNGKISYA